MIRKFYPLLLALAVIWLTGCGAGQVFPNSDTNNESQIPAENILTSNESNNSAAPNTEDHDDHCDNAQGEKNHSTPLTAEELAFFESLFARSNGMGKTFTQMLLSCEYAAPELINFAEVFLQGVPDQLGMWERDISTAEKSALRAAMGATYRDDCRKIPRTDMQNLLTQYLGLGIADTEAIGLNQFTYLEQYDAYYICSSVTNRVIPKFSSGIRRTDGVIELRYRQKTNSDATLPDTHMLVLSPSDESYRFIANLKLMPEIDIEPYRTTTNSIVSLDELSESEKEQISAVLQEFFTLHAASLAGIDLDQSPWIQSDLYHIVRSYASSLRTGYTEDGSDIFRCSGTYELLREQYDGQWLTLTVREWITLNYTTPQFETPAYASSNTCLTHVLRFTKTQTGEYYLAEHSNDWHYAHYYTNTDRVAANSGNGISAAGNPDLLPIVSFHMIENGLLYTLTPTGSGAVAVNDGAPVELSFDYWSIPLNHNDQELTVTYGWARRGNLLAAVRYSPEYSISPVPGSNRYLSLILDGGYTYLIDTTAGEILDPLAALGDDACMRLHSVNFSPDGQYAVVSHHSATVCVLLNCTTGETTQLPYASDPYSVFGHFLDNTHILLMSAVETDTPHEVENSWALYDIMTGGLTQLTGEYAPGSIHITDDGLLAYTYEDGYLVIVDLLRQEKIVTQFLQQNVDRVFYCPNTLAGVISGDILYIVDDDAAAVAVCRLER